MDTLRVGGEEPLLDGEGVSSASEDASNRRQALATDIVKNHTIMAMTAGLVPIPVFDLAAVTAIQIRMIKRITEAYGLEFKQHLAKSTVGALLAGSSAAAAGLGVASGIKTVPVIGLVSGTIGSVSMGGVITYALGTTFIRHFDGGGQLLETKLDEMHKIFADEISKAKLVVSRMRGQMRTSPDTPSSDA